jgi:very-short-patch-repair endonuclease
VAGRDAFVDAGADPAAAHLLAVRASVAGLSRGTEPVVALGSAALLHGLSRLGSGPGRVRLYRASGGPWRDDTVSVLVTRLPPVDVVRVAGLLVTSPARSAADLARRVSFVSGVVVLDSALRLGCSRRELDAVLARCTRWPGVRRARLAAEFADGRADSALESVSRVQMSKAGLPVPRLQVPIHDGHRFVARVDFLFEEFGVVGEADGLLKYDEDAAALRAEKLRQEALEDLGYRVVRWTWDDMWRRREVTLGRIARALRARGWRG